MQPAAMYSVCCLSMAFLPPSNGDYDSNEPIYFGFPTKVGNSRNESIYARFQVDERIKIGMNLDVLKIEPHDQ